MIKHIFIPERIDAYYLFGKRVAAFDIGQAEIHVTVALLTGYKRIIEKVFTERIEADSTLSADERTVQALKLAAAKLGKYDEITAALPSSQVVFKELSLPFTGMKKIKMVVPFEVESLLPFSLDTAVIDSITTHEDSESGSTDVLVAAVKKDQINHMVQLFESAGLTVHRLTVDMFELYGLYKMVTPQTNNKKTFALIDLGFYATRLAVIINGQLKYIRSIPKGLITVARKLTALNSVDPNENLQHLMRVGINEVSDQTFSQQAQESFEELISEISFTIESYTKKLKPEEQQLHKILICGAAADVPGITHFTTNSTKIDSQLFQPKQFLHNEVVQSKVTPLPNSFIVSIAAAITPEVTQEFNLQKAEIQKEENYIINSQLITLAALAGLIFLSFSLYSFFRLRNLRLAYRSAETEAINELKKSFKLKPAQTLNLTAANRAALNELKKQESAWHRLSAENRYSFLRILAELSRCIHAKDTQFDLTTLSIKEDTVKLYGSVPGYQQLIRLQNELECPLFKKLQKLQDWNFKSEPITLTINKEEL